jgi:hypothetical protein
MTYSERDEKLVRACMENHFILTMNNIMKSNFQVANFPKSYTCSKYTAHIPAHMYQDGPGRNQYCIKFFVGGRKYSLLTKQAANTLELNLLTWRSCRNIFQLW